MEYSSVLLLVQDLNHQVEQFEELKQSHEKKRIELEERERNLAKLAKEAAGTLGAVAEFVKNNEGLRNHIQAITSAFEELAAKCDLPCEQTILEKTSQETILEELDEPKKSEPINQTNDVEEIAEVVVYAADSTTPEQEEQEVVLKATFPEAHHVELAADRWNWSPKPMEKTEDSWEMRERIPSGSGMQFKFIVDGEWKCSDKYPRVQNNGVDNNCIHCQ